MKLIGISMLFVSLLAGTSASAHCWEECALPNPISGGCGQWVKSCDIENPGKAAISLTGDLHGATSRVAANWHEIYGDVIPQSLRNVLDRYPLTIACAIFPETRGYALVMGAIEGIVAHSKDRDHEASFVEAVAPDWKKNVIDAGKAFLWGMESDDFGATNWNDPATNPFGDRYHQVFTTFLDCMEAAKEISDGQKCMVSLHGDAFKAEKQ